MSNPTWVSDDLLLELSDLARYSGSHYRPNEQCSREELSAALVRSVLLGNEPKTDEAGCAGLISTDTEIGRKQRRW